MSELLDRSFRDEVRSAVRRELHATRRTGLASGFIQWLRRVPGWSSNTWLLLCVAGIFLFLIEMTVFVLVAETTKTLFQVDSNWLTHEKHLPHLLVSQSCLLLSANCMWFGVFPLSGKRGKLNLYFPRFDDSLANRVRHHFRIAVIGNFLLSLAFSLSPGVFSLIPGIGLAILFAALNSVLVALIVVSLLRILPPDYRYGALHLIGVGFIAFCLFVGPIDAITNENNPKDFFWFLVALPVNWVNAFVYFAQVGGNWWGWLFLIPASLMVGRGVIDYRALIKQDPRQTYSEFEANKFLELLEKNIRRKADGTKAEFQSTEESVRRSIERYDRQPVGWIQSACHSVLGERDWKIRESGRLDDWKDCLAIVIGLLMFSFYVGQADDHAGKFQFNLSIALHALGIFSLSSLFVGEIARLNKHSNPHHFPRGYLSFSFALAKIAAFDVACLAPILIPFIAWSAWLQGFTFLDSINYGLRMLMCAATILPIGIVYCFPIAMDGWRRAFALVSFSFLAFAPFGLMILVSERLRVVDTVWPALLWQSIATGSAILLWMIYGLAFRLVRSCG